MNPNTPSETWCPIVQADNTIDLTRLGRGGRVRIRARASLVALSGMQMKVGFDRPVIGTIVDRAIRAVSREAIVRKDYSVEFRVRDDAGTEIVRNVPAADLDLVDTP